MIKTQKKYIDYLEVVTNQLQNINIDTSRYKDYILKIKNTELIVPVVGGFSAGKSTLINHYLGDEILSTSLTPETALATELRYSSKNYIQAIKSDESFDIFELNQSNEIKDNAAKYKYLKLYLNNDKLKFDLSNRHGIRVYYFTHKCIYDDYCQDKINVFYKIEVLWEKIVN